MIPCRRSRMNEASGWGALGTRASVTIFPFSPRTQIAVLASDASRPIWTSMSLSFHSEGMGSALQHNPANTQCVQGQRHPNSDLATSSNDAGEHRAPLRHLNRTALEAARLIPEPGEQAGLHPMLDYVAMARHHSGPANCLKRSEPGCTPQDSVAQEHASAFTRRYSSMKWSEAPDSSSRTMCSYPSLYAPKLLVCHVASGLMSSGK